jgi:hypothetical protein
MSGRLSSRSAPLRRSSERRLQQTRAQYGQLIRAMKRTEAKMASVLAAFHDQVLFLKHNRNARAIASLATIEHSPVIAKTLAHLG